MNTDSMTFDELAKLQAKSDMKPLPTAQRAGFYPGAQQRYVSTWSTFSSEAQDTCALFEYIYAFPQPTRGH